MPTILTHIKEEMGAKNLDAMTVQGRVWLLQKMKLLRPTPVSLMADRESLRTKTILGRFYFFYYDAKLKGALPYWDQFPLVIPIQRENDGFLGLNLHYIAPQDRLILLKKLHPLMNGPITDERTRLRITYPILKALHRAYEATPCIKKYLFLHIRSRFLEIHPDEWHIAATLPVHRFRGKDYRTVKDIWIRSKERY